MDSRIKYRRIPIELEKIAKTQKEHGIICTTKESNYSNLIATIPGPDGSPYSTGKFQISITIGDQYPFRPPIFKFITPVFHPNIDSSKLVKILSQTHSVPLLGGQICLELLKMPPTGTYNPAISLESILLSIQLLLAYPNPDDPLRGDAADLYKGNVDLFNEKAKKHTEKYAKAEITQSPADTEELPAEDEELSAEVKELRAEKEEVPSKKMKTN